ncbi:hypothetical protein CKO25_19115 [Thiocapsa imhoffii]|uniref:Uncharacterized protein n=1 Tax=Thiocapsa imhoffii TaxID=382777 RepID=A0A9X0WLV6_9GAMM|nr:hypothetical protein [Thiocapsa imhoffii]MBK1646710.1 hypothetical protein [Thiocapsa imhoffii]
MRELVLKLRLLEDVIVNEGPANEGGHAGLDYLPGFLLLGAAAARLYAELSRPEAWRLFHSGQVRFGDALPLANDQPTWPIPLCWHERKGTPAVREQTIDATRVRNLQFGPFEDNAQPKQLRAGYVRADGHHLSVEKSFRMKTAIDPKTGRVAEAQLFGYESIRAGQCFVARVRAANDLDDALWNRLVQVLTDQEELLLGRSRSAEYGRVAVERLDQTPSELELAPKERVKGLTVTLWCLSDVALVDHWGQPTLTPTLEALGLERGEIAWEQTFLRFRRYALWNRYRNGYDVERQVIQHGSVIGLRLPSPLTDDEYARLTAGVGLYREAGLGWVSVDPELLTTLEPIFNSRLVVPDTQPPDRPDHPLIAWLEEAAQGGNERRRSETQVQMLRKELERRYDLARRYAGVPEHLPIGPSPAQWGTLYEAARRDDSQDLGGLKTRLFDGNNALCKPSGENWQDQFRDAQGVRSFFEWFRSEAETMLSIQIMRLFLREAQRVSSRNHGRSEP